MRYEYFAPSGRCTVNTQTALAMTVMLNLEPEGTLDTCAGALHKSLWMRNFHICTGFLGTPIICRALTKAGNNEDAVTIFLKEDYPGWLYPVTMGATTTWERWDSMRPDGNVSP